MESPRVPLVILSLLQTSNIVENFNISFEVATLNDLIENAIERQRIDTIAFFSYEETLEAYIPSIMPDIPRVIITQALGELNLNSAAGFNSNIFFLAIGSIQSSIKWQFLYDAFASLQSQAKGVFVTSSARGLTEHFEWCWQKGFVKVLALVASTKLYSYTPFPQLAVFNLRLPESVDDDNYFGNRLSDLRGYNLRIAVQFDPPRVFNLVRGNTTITVGYAGSIFREFFRYHNAVPSVVGELNTTSFNIFNIIEQLNRGDIDLSMNPYLPYPGVSISYPLNMMRWCILVPARGEVPSYAYFLRPFQLETWFACFGILCYLCLIGAFNEFIESKMSIKSRRRLPDFGIALTKTLRMMLFLPVPAFYRVFRWHIAWNYMLLAVFGFILSNMYLALVASYLAKIVLEHQIDTINEIVAQNISINAIEHEIPIVLRNRGLPKGFADLLVPRNTSDLTANILALRADRAYLAREDMINFALVQQQYHQRPRLHVVNECITTIPVGFLMPSHSQFQHILDVFTLRAASAGLLDRWYQISKVEGFRAGIIKTFHENSIPTIPLTLEHFQFPYFILFGGTFLSLLSFGLEQLKRFGIRIWLKRKP